jgi:hypothetical protein
VASSCIEDSAVPYTMLAGSAQVIVGVVGVGLGVGVGVGVGLVVGCHCHIVAPGAVK